MNKKTTRAALLDGFWSVFELTPNITLKKSAYSEFLKRTDSEALRLDWLRVGEDYRDAMVDAWIEAVEKLEDETAKGTLQSAWDQENSEVVWPESSRLSSTYHGPREHLCLLEKNTAKLGWDRSSTDERFIDLLERLAQHLGEKNPSCRK